MHGWAGTILRINLTTKEIKKIPLDPGFARKWLGGEGFGAKVLWDEVGPEVKDGLHPGNLLIYTTGPLTGTLAPSCGRLEIVTKSPITGIFGDSNAGGHFAPELKRAGYDMLIIAGASEKPVYVWIDDDRVEIRPAAHLWGKTVPETDEAIKKELGDREISISCIGPAGENKVRFAILMNNIDRAPGWAGCGAVAGAKNLKAVAVRGTGGVRIARPEEFERACLETRRKIRGMHRLHELRREGTMHLFRLVHLGGFAPLDNFNVTQCSAEHLAAVGGEKWARDYFVSTNGCHGCEVHCRHYARNTSGPYAGIAGDGFEFGCVASYNLWYSSPSAAFGMAMAKYCNDNGMDATEPGMLFAWLTDCFKRGIVNEEDTEGLVLDWGNEKAAWELLRKLTYRQGIGNLLAEGLARAARNLGKGSEELAYTIKGRASVEVNLRGSHGAAIASATSTRGADHLKGWPYFEYAHLPPEWSVKYWGNAKAGDGRSPEGKAPMTAYSQAVFTLIDSLGTCKLHTSPPLDPPREDDYARMLSAATGIDFTVDELMKIGHRIYNLEQAYNVRLGLGRKDDTIPSKYLTEPCTNGPLKGFLIKKEDFEHMLDDYYRYRGWDVTTGIPTRETLEKLDLKEVADDLENRRLSQR